MNSSTYRFADFQFDVESLELSKRGKRVPLRPRVGELLRILMLAAPHHVSRQDLHRQLWEENTEVEVNSALNALMRELRSALGDSGELEQFVETLPKRGYRFIAKFHAGPARNRWLAILAVAAASVAVYFFDTNIERDVSPGSERETPIRLAILPSSWGGDRSGDAIETNQIAISIASALRDLGGQGLEVVRPDAIESLGSGSVFDAESLEVDFLLRTNVLQNSTDGIEFRALLQNAKNRESAAEFQQQYASMSNEVMARAASETVGWIVDEFGMRNPTGFGRGSVARSDEIVDMLIQARWLRNSYATPAMYDALELYNKVLAAEPNNVEALVGKIVSLSRGAPLSSMLETYDEVERLSISLQQSGREADGSADVGLAFVSLYRDWDINRAMQHVQAALLTNPQSAEAHTMYSGVRASMGDINGAIKSAEVALRLQPDQVARVDLCFYLLVSRNYERALSFCERAHRENSRVIYYGVAAAEAMLQLGNEEQAVTKLGNMILMNQPDAFGEPGKLPESWQQLGCLRAEHFTDVAEQESEAAKSRYSTLLAQYWAQCRDRQKLLYWLEIAMADRSTEAIYLRYHPRFDPWSDDAEIRALLEPAREK